LYLDDIVIYGPNLKEHNKRLIQVLDRLREHDLKLQPDKCEFLRKEKIYLGHIITEDGIRLDPKKLHAVEKFPMQESKRCIVFSRTSGILPKIYRRFLKNSETLEINQKGWKT